MTKGDVDSLPFSLYNNTRSALLRNSAEGGKKRPVGERFMKYFEKIILKDGRECLLRSPSEDDAEEVLRLFRLTHAQTGFLATYPDEIVFTVEKEAAFLRSREESSDEIYIAAYVGGRAVGTAGVDRIGKYDKVRHRASFGIGVDSEYWGLGIGRALTLACIESAKEAGYSQLELEVVASNERALGLYRSLGFAEYGRNPLGFLTRSGETQELIMMRLDLRPGKSAQ